jgi:arabinogalactan oligomer/maltooligosaccharide transport system substrate-binding protein
MARKSWKLVAVAAMLAVVATACGSNTPSASGLEGEVTLYHAYGSSGGSAEGTAFAAQLAKFEKEFPKIKISAVEVPFNEIFSKFKTEAAAGGGPDLFIAPTDELGNLVSAGLLEPITDTKDLGTVSQQALDGSTIGGKLYLVPESLKAVVMYYDSAKIKTPPATAAEFKEYVDNGGKVAVPAGVYHVWGWYKAFGGSIFDSTGHAACLNTSGVADAMDYVKSLKAAGAVVDGNDGDLGQKYMSGAVDVMFNGNWVLADYLKARPGTQVASFPAGANGVPSVGMVGVDGWHINAAGANKPLAIKVASILASPDYAKIMVTEAGHVPASTAITVENAVTKAFAAATATGTRRPVEAWMNNYWSNFGSAWDSVLLTGAAGADAAKTACKAMETANVEAGLWP